MLKKLFTTALLFLVTTAANANLIHGSFDVTGTGLTTLNDAGEVTQIDFSLNDPLIDSWATPLKASSATGDYRTVAVKDAIFSVQNPFIISNITGVELWKIAGFTFTGISVHDNNTSGVATGLAIIGTVSHVGYTDTETEWFFSTQHLVIGTETKASFSSSITSPVPTQVTEPGTLAIFALGLVGFGLRRKQKPV
ncbi:MAG TPA: hypothetical protein DEO86_17745 [Colwellia sp.]|nr:hypothetical protein [Colwellia sp.]|tara:strand:+ start:3344 stop:3928 length:585 start_codon:yes stop_codon:yes gene_type:complete